jgi:hypothetical protein
VDHVIAFISQGLDDELQYEGIVLDHKYPHRRLQATETLSGILNGPELGQFRGRPSKLSNWKGPVEPRQAIRPDIDADHGDRGIGCLRHGVLLGFGAPCQLPLLAGQEHGRTIPLTDLALALASVQKSKY